MCLIEGKSIEMLETYHAMIWFCRRFLAVYQFYTKLNTHVNKAPFVKSNQGTLFNIPLHQTGQLDQPEVHPFLRSPAFRQSTFCQI